MPGRQTPPIAKPITSHKEYYVKFFVFQGVQERLSAVLLGSAPAAIMRISLLSDTHHNFGDSSGWPYPLPDHDILVLAGDISEYVNSPANLTEVLAHYRSRTDQPILYLPGNHEFYRHDYHQALAWIRRDTDQFDIELLNCRSIRYGDVAFHGCTLWSDFTLFGAKQADLYGLYAEESVTDFYAIGFENKVFRHTDCAELHRQERAWLEKSLSSSEAPYNVVITHFAPVSQCIAERYQGDRLNPYFVAGCEDLAERFEPDLWLYGHTHQPDDFILGKTRFVNNARGYPRENSGIDFKPDKVLEIGGKA